MAAVADSASGWRIKPSLMAQRSNNPIRQIVDKIKKPNLPDKPLIPLSLGDPTIFGNFRAPDVLEMTLHRLLASGKHNGYIHSAGSMEARKAIAKKYSVDGFPLNEDDVIIASGCSGALDLAITALLDAGDVLVLPRPAFPLYQTLAESKGIQTAHYRLLPDTNWEADLSHLEETLSTLHKAGKSTALLVNNPSNPCGSVYSEAHLRAILALAERFRTPVIADEIYGGLVFPSSGATFVPMASLTSTVPILSAGGLAKEYLVPGWRVGWVIVHDRQGLFTDVRKGLMALTQLILGANSLVVGTIPALLDPVPNSPEAASLGAFRTNTIAQLQDSADYCAARLRCMPGLTLASVPQGAMYLMFGLTPSFFAPAGPAGSAPSGPSGPVAVPIRDDVELAQALLAEENVFVLPGQCFTMPGYCRIVFCAPKAKLAEAMDRLEAFLLRHAADPAAAAATLSSNKAGMAKELARLGAPFVPPAPAVNLGWAGLPEELVQVEGQLSPRLTFLATSAIRELSGQEDGPGLGGRHSGPALHLGPSATGAAGSSTSSASLGSNNGQRKVMDEEAERGRAGSGSSEGSKGAGPALSDPQPLSVGDAPSTANAATTLPSKTA